MKTVVGEQKIARGGFIDLSGRRVYVRAMRDVSDKGWREEVEQIARFNKKGINLNIIGRG